MRVAVVALSVLLLQAMPVGAQVEEPVRWVLWAEDDPSELGASMGDIDEVRVGTSPAAMHLQLTTYDSTETPLVASSGMRFTIDQQADVPVAFVWEDRPMLTVDGEARDEWQATEGSGPLGWHIQVPWSALGIDVANDFALRDMTANAAVAGVEDTAAGPDIEFTVTDDGLRATTASLAEGLTIEGPDYGGGTSVTTDALGEPILAYYIYDGDRGDPRGIYIATVAHDRFIPERVSDVTVTREQGRDAQMRTQIAHDGQEVFVLFTDDPAVDNDPDGVGHPGTPDSVFVLARGTDGWHREDPTPGGTSDVGAEDVADLAARDGQVVAAVPVGDDVWITTRTNEGDWERVATLPQANNAKLAIDSVGIIHAAYVVYGEGMRDGELFYAQGVGGFQPTRVGGGIDAGWEEPETDGSFAIATGPEDQVAILWNDGLERDRDREQRVAILKDGQWSHDHAPLRPGHGNPQYTMRLDHTADGVLVAASGYGGTDRLAARVPSGAWTAMDLDRYDVWDMAVAPSGHVYFGYTQPHGGTTVALSVFHASGVAVPGEQIDAASGAARTPPAPLVFVALFVVAAAARRW